MPDSITALELDITLLAAVVVDVTVLETALVAELTALDTAVVVVVTTLDIILHPPY